MLDTGSVIESVVVGGQPQKQEKAMVSSTLTTEALRSPTSGAASATSSRSASPRSASPRSALSKAPALPPNSRAVDHVFILWGEDFFESNAIIFATMLREAGICVKLVGVHGLQAAGRNRILIQADLAVTAAINLAERACVIILPCSQTALRRLGNDPRLHQLFQQATANGAYFLVSPDIATTTNGLKFLGVLPQRVIQYAADDELISFVQRFAPQLAGLINGGADRTNPDRAGILANMACPQQR